MSKSISNFRLIDYENNGLEKVEKREWREALEVGEKASTLVVVCAVDAEKCTFKVSSSFTTIQFHSHDQTARLAMLQKLASMQNAAGEWGLERAAHYSEAKSQRTNPDQLKMGFGDDNGEN